MSALLKTAALAATLCLGVAGTAQATTTTQSYTFGQIQLGPNWVPLISTGSQAVAAGTQLTFSVLSGNGTITLRDDASLIYSSYDVSAQTQPVSWTFADASNFSYSGYGYAGMTFQLTFVAPDPVVPLPASLPLFAGALGMAGVVARRRKALQNSERRPPGEALL